jgi:hypothetical protein
MNKKKPLSENELVVKGKLIEALEVPDWRAEEMVREKQEQMKLRKQIHLLKELEK